MSGLVIMFGDLLYGPLVAMNTDDRCMRVTGIFTLFFCGGHSFIQ